MEAVGSGRLPVCKGYMLSEEDRIRRHVIMRLMCDMGLDFDSLDRQLGTSTEDYFSDELGRLGPFEEDGLLERSPGRLRVTDIGRLFIRNIAMTFDAYLDTSKTRYSKTV